MPSSDGAAKTPALEEIDAAFSASNPPAGVIYRESALQEMADAAEAALLRRDKAPIMFQRGGFLMRLARRPAMTVRGVQVAESALAIIPATADWLRARCTESETWLRADKRSDALKRVSCPELVVRTLLANDGGWRSPAIRAITECPTLRSNGSILQTPGYDQATAVYYDPGAEEFPQIPHAPTLDDVAGAREELEKLLGDFPFCDPHDRAVMLAAILTAIVRTSLATAPLFAFSAPVRGSGKTAAAQLVAAIATGRPAPVIQQSTDAAEENKFLLSVLLEGYPVALIDNVERALKSSALCSLLTAEMYAGRLLGKTGMVSAPNCATFMATGNNLVISGDLTSRTLVCRLDPKMENPSTREFARDIYAYAAERRPRLVWSALVLIRGYLASAERGRAVVPWNRFPAWCSLVRGALVWNGYADPCEALRQLEDEDPDRQQHAAVLSAWRQSFGDEKVTTREMIQLAMAGGNHELGEALRDVAADRDGTINARSLGWWLSRHADRILDGHCLKKAGSKHKAGVWRVIGA